MIAQSFPIWLERRSSGERVKGLITRAGLDDVLSWADWEYSPDDEDREWNWIGLYTESLQSPGRFECYSTFALRDSQGLMRLDLGSPDDPPSPSVVVDYLATNPANRSRGSGLKYIGVTLIAVAVMRSRALGRRGRIALESLPGAETFYSSLGMRKLHRKSEDGYSIFTLSESRSLQLLDEIRKKGIVSM
jgi:hypothetical protein